MGARTIVDPMISRLFWGLQLGAALGSSLVAGVFFAFSSFVMPALARLPAAQGIAAMQSINVAVLNRSFLSVFVGSAALCVLVGARAVSRWPSAGSSFELVGSALYLLGCVLVTGVCNVPYNGALAGLLPESERAASMWREYVTRWSSWNHVRGAFSFAAAVLFVLSLGGCSRYWDCAPPDSEKLAQLPQKLSDTGNDAASVREFRPRFELWSDGARKRRFIALPAGERIDTSDADNWRFPVGTKLWKEFVVDGARVETRLLQKVGPGTEDWLTQAYVWTADGSDALATPGGKTDALGTAHDVPAAGECLACHGGRKSFVLGFSAVQLAYDAAPGLLDLDDLVNEQLVTRAMPTRLQLPGDDTARAALGYVHGNCAHCHNQDRPEAAAGRCYDPENGLDFWLKTGELGSVESTATYRSGRGKAFEPGAPDDSRMIELMSTRGFLRQMPPLGTEQVDERAVGLVRGFIGGLR
jgi:uncharacterized membrane protein